LLLADTIDIDLENPERNREILVFSVADVAHDGNVYNCFAIMLFVDVRDAAKGQLTASLVSDTEVLLTMPSLPYGLYHDSTARNLRLELIQLHCPKLQLSQDIVINQVRESQTRPLKRLLLRFPKGVVLANVFNVASPATLLADMQTDMVMANLGSQAVPVINCFMTWRVANLETHRRATVVANTPAPVDVLAAQFASMLTQQTKK
jgi:hypothetical protein